MADDKRPRQSPPMGMANPGMSPKVRAKDTRGTLLRLWTYLGRQRRGLIAVGVLSVLTTALTLSGPYLIGIAIDHYILPGDYNGLLRLCVLLLAIFAATAFFLWLQSYIIAGVAQKTVWELRRDLFGWLQLLPLQFFDSKTHGELMSRTTNDVENVNLTLNQSIAQLLSSILTLIGALAFMFSLQVWLTLISLFSIPLVIWVTSAIVKQTRRYFSEQQKQLGGLNGYVEETITGQKVVKVFCREETATRQFHHMNKNLRDVSVKAQIFSGTMAPVMNLINNLSFALIAAIGGWMVLQESTSIGVVVAFLNYSKQFSRPINEIANQFNLMQAGIAGAERVFEILDENEEFADTAAAKPIETIKGEVRFDNVTFGYSAETPILKRISLTARPGDTVALIGPTGAGKTTIVNLLTRFYDIRHGMITIDGVDLQSIDKRSLRRQLGIVLQDAYLFSGTIRENVRYGRLEATDEEVEAAARLAHADGFIRKLPDGYDTTLTAEGGNLSHGQRQLLTIARAILADPAILILDEATSSIDTRTEMHIQEAMKSLMKGRTSFVIAHRLSTIRDADQILVIDGGEIIEQGTHDQLVETQGFYYKLYTSQFKRII